MINALWFPPNSARPTSAPGAPTTSRRLAPTATTTANTATDYGFMLAYNQFSSNSSLQTAGMGGWGRKGAQKLVILETDGMAKRRDATARGVTNNWRLPVVLQHWVSGLVFGLRCLRVPGSDQCGHHDVCLDHRRRLASRLPQPNNPVID